MSVKIPHSYPLKGAVMYKSLKGAAIEQGPSHAVDVQRDEALQAFLAAAGSTAEVVLNRPALHAAFETRPLELSVDPLRRIRKYITAPLRG